MKIKKILPVIVLLAALPGWAVQAAPEALAPAAVTPAEPSLAATGTSERISVSFRDADIQSVLQVLALKGNVNIVAGPNVIGEVTVQLQDVPWKNAFETVLRVLGYTYEKEDNIYYVMTPEEQATRRAVGERSEVYKLQYANINEVTIALQQALPNVRVQPVARANQVIITGAPSILENATRIIERIDQRQLQVYIDTKIISTALSKEENLGINWRTMFEVTGAARPTTFPFAEDPSSRRFGKFLQRFDYLPQGQTAQESTTTTTSGGGQSTASQTEFPKGHSFPFVDPNQFQFGTLDFSAFRVAFNFIERRTNTKIVSNPRIVVQNHQHALIQVGDTISIPNFERNAETGIFEINGFEDRETGILLNVTPHITEKNEVLLTVRPEIITPTPREQTQFNVQEDIILPEFSTVTAETTVLVNNGDTLVIGGLILDDERDEHNKVPYLHRIPVLGRLFRSMAPEKTRVEYIFFVTVTLADHAYNEKMLNDWQKKQQEYEEFRQATEAEYAGKSKDKEKKS